MRFFKEQWGIFWEFNSLSEYASFLLGRLLGVIIFVGAIILAIWLLA